MKRFFTVLIVALCGSGARAQTNISSAEIYLGLKKLEVVGSVLYVAAHPDDENTRLLTYLSKDRLVRTGYLSLTRGDGGQNLVGDEQGIPLGLIRTQELLSARRIDGAEQFFSRAYDFGFSKTPEETFTKWDREKILADVVWVVRKFQPDVIITRFPTTGEGGHGHHTASAILANEAFTAAADPKRFPDQLKYVRTWQAKRILWNVFGGNASNPDLFRTDVGGYNAVIGKSYGEVAAESRSQHKSQGFGVERTRGEAFEYFRTTGGAAPVTDLFDEVDLSWKRVPGGEPVASLISNTIDSFNFLQPQKSLPSLVEVYKKLTGLPESSWKQQKIKEVTALIEQASGLYLEAFTREPFVAQGDSARISFLVNNRLGATVTLERIGMEDFDTTFRQALAANKNIQFTKTWHITGTHPVTQPYWLQLPMQEGYYTVHDQLLIGQPDADPAFLADFLVRIGDVSFRIMKPIRYKFVDPVKGEQYQPFVILPPVSVYANPELLLVRKDDAAIKPYSIQAVANKRINSVETTAFSQVEKLRKSVKDGMPAFAKGAQKTYAFQLSSKELKGKEARIFPSVQAEKGMENNLARAIIKYDHIPWISYFYTDYIKALPIDLVTYGKRIGYIVGAGDKVPEALEEMGYEVTLLSDKELLRNNLQQYDAIISGVRAYNTNEWLNSHHEKLMAYVAEGGNLIVQYNTSNNNGPVRARMGPYNFNISRARITDETAPVSFLNPGHAVLNFPNRITQDDFTGWVQERSIYHAAPDMDPAYETIISMADPKEPPDAGSLIVAKHGKGYFTYTGLVFFRQLPAGVPGAYRLLANLIALNQKKEF